MNARKSVEACDLSNTVLLKIEFLNEETVQVLDGVYRVPVKGENLYGLYFDYIL